MAAGFVSKPGDEYGPCAEACDHLDCKASRETADCKCRICGKAIGFETRYFDEWYDHDESVKREKGRYGFFVHERCAYQEADAKRKAVVTAS